MAVPTYPKLELLMRELYGKLSSSGARISVDNSLKKANFKLNNAKVNCLQKQIMDNELRRIVLLRKSLDRNSDYFQIPCDEFENRLQILAQHLNDRQDRLAQLCHFINNELSRPEDPCPFFFEISCIINFVYISSIYEDHKQLRQDPLSFVNNMLAILKKTKDEYDTAVLVQRNVIDTHRRLSSKDAKLLLSTAEMILNYNFDEEEFSYFALKLKLMMLKTRDFTLKTEAETYSAKTVEAHKKISEHLRKATDEAETKKVVLMEQLAVYEATGPEFTVLLKTYLRILQETKECKWMLTKLSINGAA